MAHSRHLVNGDNMRLYLPSHQSLAQGRWYLHHDHGFAYRQEPESSCCPSLKCVNLRLTPPTLTLGCPPLPKARSPAFQGSYMC